MFRPNVFPLLSANNCARPIVCASKPGHVRAALLSRIRVVERVVVHEVVAGQQAEQLRVAVEAHRSFVVAHRLRERARRQRVAAGVRRRHARQQLLRRRRPRALRDHGARKHALRGRRAARRVVRLARSDVVAQPLREHVRKVRPVHDAVEVVGDVREVSGPIQERRHRDIARLDALRRPRRLVVAEEEQLAAHQGPADCPARLVLVEFRAFGREVVAGIEVGVAEELEHVAAEHVAARLRDDVDDAAVVVPVFRIEVVRQQPELLDRIEVRDDAGAAVHPLLHVGAVDVEAVGGFALAADRDDAGVELA